MYTKIKELRKIKNLTQQQLADKVNIKKNTIASYEAGFINLSIDNAIVLANFFNVSIDYLLCREDEEGFILNSNLTSYENYVIETVRNMNNEDLKTFNLFLEFIKHKQK